MGKQLVELVRPIPKRLIEEAPFGKQGSYVPHFVIAQALLATVGPYDWQLVEVLRGPVPEHQQMSKDKKTVVKVWPALPSAIVGAVFRLTVTVDGQRITVEEAGSCDAAAFEINDGERLKKAASDALKRCAMRLGVAIHLWCKRPDQFFVHRLLSGEDAEKHEAVVGVEGQDEEPVAEPTASGEPQKPPSQPIQPEPDGTVEERVKAMVFRAVQNAYKPWTPKMVKDRCATEYPRALAALEVSASLEDAERIVGAVLDLIKQDSNK